MDRSDLAIILPAYNEELTICETIAAVSEFGQVIVVNDCSTDKTESASISRGALVVTHDTNRGYDEALNTGFRTASEEKFKFVVTFDADGQHPANYIPKFLKLLEDGNDIVVGERPRKQRIAEVFFGWIMSVRFGIRDPLCGMKGYRVSLHDRLGWFDSYGSVGTELLIFALKNNASIISVKIPIKDRIDDPRFGSFMGNIKIFKAMLGGLKTLMSK